MIMRITLDVDALDSALGTLAWAATMPKSDPESPWRADWDTAAHYRRIAGIASTAAAYAERLADTYEAAARAGVQVPDTVPFWTD
jgi:hypothetical protein